jgi:hypothetical protein
MSSEKYPQLAEAKARDILNLARRHHLCKLAQLGQPSDIVV